MVNARIYQSSGFYSNIYIIAKTAFGKHEYLDGVPLSTPSTICFQKTYGGLEA
jgi:hypothetical protein